MRKKKWEKEENGEGGVRGIMKEGKGETEEKGNEGESSKEGKGVKGGEGRREEKEIG